MTFFAHFQTSIIRFLPSKSGIINRRTKSRNLGIFIAATVAPATRSSEKIINFTPDMHAFQLGYEGRQKSVGHQHMKSLMRNFR